MNFQTRHALLHWHLAYIGFGFPHRIEHLRFGFKI